MLRTVNIFILGLVIFSMGCDRSPKPPMLIVDLDAVAQQLGEDQVIKEKLEAMNRSFTEQLTAAQQELSARLQTQIEQAGQELTDEQEAKLKAERQNSVRQLRAGLQEAQNRLKVRRAELIQAFRERIKPYAEHIARERQVPVVMLRADNLMVYPSTIDITNAVVLAYRADHPAAAGEPSAQTSNGDSAAP